MPPFFKNFSLKKKRTDNTVSSSKPQEKPADPNATTVVLKRTEEADRVESTDAALTKKQGKQPEKDGVSSEPTHKVDKPEQVNEESKQVLSTGEGDDMTDELLAFLYVSQQYTMTQVVYTKHSEYVPNAMPMFIILDEALRLMGTSAQLGKYYSNFNPYAVKIGYAYIYYFQIIRAKINAGIFDGREPSMISRFTKAIPFTTIPIANILFPYLKTIVATKTKDAKYDWIVPTFGSGNHELPYNYELNAGRYNVSYRNGLEYSCPNIPAMMMILSSFGAETQMSLTPKLVDGVYRPFNMTGANAATTGFNLPNASFDFADAATDLVAEDAYTIFRTCGASERFRFWTDDAQTARRYMSDSSFYGRGKPAVYATALPPNSPAPQANFRAFTNIEEFLFLTKDVNPAFFGYILENLMIFSKFWPSSKSLDQVPMTGGLMTTIKTHLRFVTEPAGPAADNRLYADRTCGLNHPNSVRWYPQLFDGLTANFTTSRGGVTRMDELMAFTFGTNSIPPIANIQAGAAARNFRSGKFFEEDTDEAIRYRLGENILNHAGYKPMYDGWSSEVLAKFLNAKPN